MAGIDSALKLLGSPATFQEGVRKIIVALESSNGDTVSAKSDMIAERMLQERMFSRIMLIDSASDVSAVFFCLLKLDVSKAFWDKHMNKVFVLIKNIIRTRSGDAGNTELLELTLKYTQKVLTKFGGSSSELVKIFFVIYDLCFDERKEVNGLCIDILRTSSPFLLHYFAKAEFRDSFRGTYEVKLSKMVLSAHPNFGDVFGLTVDLFGKNLHTDVNLLNSLLKCEEKALKVKNPAFKVQAIRAWSKIIDSFALVKEIIRNVKRLSLLMLPLLKMEESTMEIAREKLTVWVHLLGKLSSPITHFNECVLRMLDQMATTLTQWPDLADDFAMAYIDLLREDGKSNEKLPTISETQFSEHSSKLFGYSRALLRQATLGSKCKDQLLCQVMNRAFSLSLPSLGESLKELRALVSMSSIPNEAVCSACGFVLEKMSACATRHVGNPVLCSLLEELIGTVFSVVHKNDKSAEASADPTVTLKQLLAIYVTVQDVPLPFLGKVVERLDTFTISQSERLEVWQTICRFVIDVIKKTESCNEGDQFTPKFDVVTNSLISPFPSLIEIGNLPEEKLEMLMKEWGELYKLVISTVDLEINGSAKDFREDLLKNIFDCFQQKQIGQACGAFTLQALKEAFENSSLSHPRGEEPRIFFKLASTAAVTSQNDKNLVILAKLVRHLIPKVYPDLNQKIVGAETIARISRCWQDFVDAREGPDLSRVKNLLKVTEPLFTGNKKALISLPEAFSEIHKTILGEAKTSSDTPTSVALPNPTFTRENGSTSKPPDVKASVATKPDLILSASSPKTPKRKQKEEFVVIASPATPKTRILTERQKEKMRESRATIPAMYHDYSQDSMLVCQNSSQSQSLLSKPASSTDISVASVEKSTPKPASATPEALPGSLSRNVATPSSPVVFAKKSIPTIDDSPEVSCLTHRLPKPVLPAAPVVLSGLDGPLPNIMKLLSPAGKKLTGHTPVSEQRNLEKNAPGKKAKSEKKEGDKKDKKERSKTEPKESRESKKRRLSNARMEIPSYMDESAIASPVKVSGNEGESLSQKVPAFKISSGFAVNFTSPELQKNPVSNGASPEIPLIKKTSESVPSSAPKRRRVSASSTTPKQKVAKANRESVAVDPPEISSPSVPENLNALFASPIRNSAVTSSQEKSPTWDSHPFPRADSIVEEGKEETEEMEVDLTEEPTTDALAVNSTLALTDVVANTGSKEQDEVSKVQPATKESSVEDGRKTTELDNTPDLGSSSAVVPETPPGIEETPAKGRENEVTSKRVKNSSSLKKSGSLDLEPDEKSDTKKVSRELMLLAATTGPNSNSGGGRRSARKSLSQPLPDRESTVTPRARRNLPESYVDTPRPAKTVVNTDEEPKIDSQSIANKDEGPIESQTLPVQIATATPKMRLNVPENYVDTPHPVKAVVNPNLDPAKDGQSAKEDAVSVESQQPSAQVSARPKLGRQRPVGYTDTPRPARVEDESVEAGYESGDELFAKKSATKNSKKMEMQDPVETVKRLESTEDTEGKEFEDSQNSQPIKEHDTPQVALSLENRTSPLLAAPMSSPQIEKKKEAKSLPKSASLDTPVSPSKRPAARAASLDILPEDVPLSRLRGTPSMKNTTESQPSPFTEGSRTTRKSTRKGQGESESQESPISVRPRRTSMPTRKMRESPLLNLISKQKKNSDLVKDQKSNIDAEEIEAKPDSLAASVTVDRPDTTNIEQVTTTLVVSSESESESQEILRVQVRSVISDLEVSSPPKLDTQKRLDGKETDEGSDGENADRMPASYVIAPKDNVSEKDVKEDPVMEAILAQVAVDRQELSSSEISVPSRLSTAVDLSDTSVDPASSTTPECSPQVSSETCSIVDEALSPQDLLEGSSELSTPPLTSEPQGRDEPSPTIQITSEPQGRDEPSPTMQISSEEHIDSPPISVVPESADIFDDPSRPTSPRRTPRKSPSKPVEKVAMDTVKCNLSFDAGQDEIIPSSLPEKKLGKASPRCSPAGALRASRFGKSLPVSGRSAQLVQLAQAKGKQLEKESEELIKEALAAGSNQVDESNQEKENESKLLSPSKPWKRHSYSPSASPSSSILKRKLDDPDVFLSPPSKSRKVTFRTPEVSDRVQIPRKEGSELTPRVGLRKRRLLGKQDSITICSDEETLETVDSTQATPETIFTVESGKMLTDTQESTLDFSLSPSLCPPTPVGLLERDLPIFADLQNCEDDVSRITCDLTSRVWREKLTRSLKERKILTVGDLCSLPERIIHELDVKPPKIDSARSVMQKYYVKWRKQSKTEETAVNQVIDDASPADLTELAQDMAQSSSEVIIEEHSVVEERGEESLIMLAGFTSLKSPSERGELDQTPECRREEVLDPVLHDSGMQTETSCTEISTDTSGLLEAESVHTQCSATMTEMSTDIEGLINAKSSEVQCTASTSETSMATDDVETSCCTSQTEMTQLSTSSVQTEQIPIAEQLLTLMDSTSRDEVWAVIRRWSEKK